MHTRSQLSFLAAAIFAIAPMSTVSANLGGMEAPGIGVQAQGRAGASIARQDDALVLHLNPANLAAIRGLQAHLSITGLFQRTCFESSLGVPEYTTEYFDQRTPPGGTYPEVCNEFGVNPVPQFAVAWRLHERIGVGIGIQAPVAGVGLHYGDTVEGRPGITTANGFHHASGVRGDLIEQFTPVAFANIGVGVAVHERVRIGANFGAGMAFLDFTTAASADLTTALNGVIMPDVTSTAPDNPSDDAVNAVVARDMFIPRASFSVAVNPIDNLDIVLGGTWTDAIRATGNLKVQPYIYHGTEEGEELPRLSTVTNANGDDAEIEIPLPITAHLALRYAQRRNPREPWETEGVEDGQVVGDAMTDEVWDIELNVHYEMNSMVDQFTVRPPTGASTTANTSIGPAEITLPPEIALAQNWQDQLSFQLGGEYQLVPGRVSVRGGAFYETHGIERGYERVSFAPMQRIGVSGGFTARIRRMDIHFAYMHIHSFHLTNNADTAAVRQLYGVHTATIGGGAPIGPVNAQGPIVNQGRFRSNFNMITIGLNYHFQ